MNSISINNFGLIKETTIDIKPLTVFTGANSSGKSFIAKLIHCLSSIGDIPSFDVMKYLDDDSQRLFKKIDEESINHFKNSTEPFEVPMDELNLLIKEGIFKFFSLIYSDIINDQFEEDLNNLINFKNDFFKIKTDNITMKKQKNEPLDFDYEFNNENLFITSQFSEFYHKCFLEILKNIPSIDSYYIPAERFEIIIDKKMLSRRVKNESDLSKNQSDVLSDIINIDSDQKGEFYKLGCEFDLEFSGIIVDVEEKNFINDIIYKDYESDEQLPSKLLSTSIHEMTLFSLYLKYILKEGDLLIIEEPEAHLHPENQRLLLKYIVKAVNMGLNIIITTHSENISDQLNNFVRLNNVSDEKIRQLNYTQDCILDCNDLSIYNFKKLSNYEYVAEKLDIDETGFFEENFSKIVDELYAETVEITNSSLR